MAEAQRKIKPAVKAALLREAGGKCANPGCANSQVHHHHIKHWAVYRVHNTHDMIAVCPACHYACHYGRLKISDEALYAWKGIARPELPTSTHVYIEPGQELKILTGTIEFTTGNARVSVFTLPNGSHLTLRRVDNDILHVSAQLNDSDGRELLRVVENTVRFNRSNAMQVDQYPGRVRVTVDAAGGYAPQWLIEHVRVHEPQYAADGRVVALDVEVLRPGVARIQGCWPARDVGVVVTRTRLAFCDRLLREPISYQTQGGAEGAPPAVIQFVGDKDGCLFGFVDGPPAAIVCDRVSRAKASLSQP